MGGWVAKIWATRCPFGAFRVPFWHHFGVLEAPVAAYWDLWGHIVIMSRGGGDFK